jgi:speckle-type POZ protein
MEPDSTNLTEAVLSVRHLKIEGYSATRTVVSAWECIKSTCNVSGYDWEVGFYHAYSHSTKSLRMEYWVTLKLVLLSDPRPSKVRANFGCRLVDPSRALKPSEVENESRTYLSAGASGGACQVLLVRSDYVPSSGYLKNDCLTVECTITVLKDVQKIVIPAQKANVPLPVPPSDMHQHFGEPLQSQTGADVTFMVSGESFAAHKLVLAARSPVFLAEFFGPMNESSSNRVRINDVDSSAFEAMLRFIYTDTVPEMAATLAQHLLAFADRYGLDRLKVICEAKLSGCIGIETAATTLALAEQHNSSLLKAKCIEFITESPDKLDAVLATEGYMHLAASCPMVLAELLRTARGRKN